MGVTTTNLLQGPATLRVATFGTVEPESSVAAPGAGWRDVGATNDGCKLTVETSYQELEVDQIPDVPGQTLTKRVAKIATNLAEATLENWALALNELDEAVASETGVKTFEPTIGAAAFVPNYRAVMLDGIAPGGFARRVIVRRVLNLSSPESDHKKDAQTLIPVEFGAHFVTTSVAPFIIIDQTA